MKTLTTATILAAVFAVGAHAAEVSFSDSIALQTTSWSDTMELGQFDPSLGTLTGVTFELFGSVVGDAKAESLDAKASTVSLTLVAEIEASLADFGSLGVVLPVANETIDFSAFDSVIDFGGTSGVEFLGLTGSDDTSNTLVGGFAPFIGLGTLIIDVTAAGTSAATGSGNLVTQFATNALASGRITYTYEEPTPAVPLPAAGWAMLAAIGSLAAFKSRKRA